VRPSARWCAFAVLGVTLALSAPCHAGNQPETVVLWPAGAPGSEGRSGEAERVRLTELGEHIVSSVHRPSVTVYLPARASATRTAVIVVPGGGHTELWMDHEGYRVAEYLA